MKTRAWYVPKITFDYRTVLVGIRSVCRGASCLSESFHPGTERQTSRPESVSDILMYSFQRVYMPEWMHLQWRQPRGRLSVLHPLYPVFPTTDEDRVEVSVPPCSPVSWCCVESLFPKPPRLTSSAPDWPSRAFSVLPKTVQEHKLASFN